jgi:hypothetical protein
VVGVQEPGARAVQRAALVRQDRLVLPGEHVAAQQPSGALILDRELVAVIQELGRAVGFARRLPQPAERIVMD